MTTNYFDYFRKNTETVDDVLAFLNKYMANVYPDKTIKVKIGQSVCTDMVGNIYLTIDTLCEFLDKSPTVKDASLRLLGDVLHEFMHWIETDKDAWDNGVKKHKSPKEQQLKQYIINCLEDGRGEAAFMNKFYGTIYPLLYSNNAVEKKQVDYKPEGLDAILANMIGLAVNYRTRDFELDDKHQKLQDDIIALMQDKNIWSLPSTQAVVDVSDEIFEMIMTFIKDNQEDSQQQMQQQPPQQQSGDGQGQDDSQSQQNQNGDGESDSNDSSNGQNSSNQNGKEDKNNQNSSQQGQSGNQSDQKNNQGKSSQSQTNDNKNDSQGNQDSSVKDLNDVDFEALKESFKNYHEEAPGREQGYQQEDSHDDFIDFSNIVNDLDITSDDVHIPELEELSKKYDENQGSVEYTKDKPQQSGLSTTDNNQSLVMPDLSQLDDQFSSHKDIKMTIKPPIVTEIERNIYEQNKFALETDIEELLFLLRNILKKKIENQTDEIVYSGFIDQDKLLNIALEKFDIFEVINASSNEIDNSMFIGVDLSGSMMPRQKHVIKSLILLHEVLKSLGVKHAIWGFNTSGREVHHHPFITFDNYNDEDASYNLGALRTYGENRDGYSIRFFNHYIQEKGKQPLYITMTDGNPNHYRYSGKSAISDTKLALEDMGLPTIAFCIGDKENMNIQSIYDNSIECEAVHELPEMLHEFLLDILH